MPQATFPRRCWSCCPCQGGGFDPESFGWWMQPSKSQGAGTAWGFPMRPGETVEFRILRGGSRVKNILDFRKADFGLFQRRRMCLEESHGTRPWREKRPRKLPDIKGSPPPIPIAIHPNEQGVMQKCQEACTGEQGAPGKTQAQKRSTQKVKAGRNIEVLSKHAGMRLGKPKPSWN